MSSNTKRLSVVVAGALLMLAAWWLGQGPEGPANERSPLTHPPAGGDPALLVGHPPKRAHQLRVRIDFPSVLRMEDSHTLLEFERAGVPVLDLVVRFVGVRLEVDPADPELLPAGFSLAATSRIGTTAYIAMDGLVPGEYSARAGTISSATPLLRARVEGFGHPSEDDLVLSLSPPDQRSYLAVRVWQGQRRVDDCKFVVDKDGERVASFSSSVDKGEIRAVPSGRLVITIVGYPGSEELGLPPAQDVDLAPRQILDVEFQIPTGVEVLFRVHDSEGEQAPFSLSVWRIDQDGWPVYVDVAELFRARHNLTTWLGRLAPGSYVAQLSPRRGTASVWHEFAIVEGAETQSHTVTSKAQGTRLRLELVGSDGEPLAKFAYNLNRSTNDRLQDTETFIGRTDERGRQTSPPLRAGRYQLWLWNLGLVREIDLPVEGLQRIEVPLARHPSGASIRGRVLDGVTSKPDSGVAKVILRGEGPWMRFARISADGSYSFSAVAAGDYSLLVPFSWFRRRAFAAYRSARTIRVNTGDAVEYTIELERK